MLLLMGVMVTVMTMIMVMMMTIIMTMMMMNRNLIKTPLSSVVPDHSTLLQLNHAVCSRGEQTIQDIFDLIIFSFRRMTITEILDTE